MKETGLRSTTLAATPDDGNSPRKRRSDFLGIDLNDVHFRLNSQCNQRLTSSAKGVDSANQRQLMRGMV